VGGRKKGNVTKGDSSQKDRELRRIGQPRGNKKRGKKALRRGGKGEKKPQSRSLKKKKGRGKEVGKREGSVKTPGISSCRPLGGENSGKKNASEGKSEGYVRREK